jgi:hypothetical protein
LLVLLLRWAALAGLRSQGDAIDGDALICLQAASQAMNSMGKCSLGPVILTDVISLLPRINSRHSGWMAISSIKAKT